MHSTRISRDSSYRPTSCSDAARWNRTSARSYLLLFASGAELERETRAALHRAIGLCSIEIGDFREAEVSLLQAIALNEALGQPVEVLKSKTAYGRLLQRSGDSRRAIPYLRPVRHEFLRHQLVEEAGICGLEIVEASLNVGETSEAERLARQIIGEFSVAGFSKRAIAALGWLTEAIAANRASAAAVTRVREYIVSLRSTPERDFVASP